MRSINSVNKKQWCEFNSLAIYLQIHVRRWCAGPQTTIQTEENGMAHDRPNYLTCIYIYIVCRWSKGFHATIWILNVPYSIIWIWLISFLLHLKKLLFFPDYCCCCCRFHLFDVFQWKTTTPTGKTDSSWIPFCCSLFCLNKYPFTTFIDRTFSSNDGPARNRKEKRANSLD